MVGIKVSQLVERPRLLRPSQREVGVAISLLLFLAVAFLYVLISCENFEGPIPLTEVDGDAATGVIGTSARLLHLQKLQWYESEFELQPLLFPILWNDKIVSKIR